MPKLSLVTFSFFIFVRSAFSIPPVQVLQEIFTSTSTSHISFYEFLMALARNEMLNAALGKFNYQFYFQINLSILKENTLYITKATFNI